MAQFVIQAVVTNTAKERMAKNIALQPDGGSFIVDKFVLGNGGHDPGNPAVALAPDPTLGDTCTGEDCPSIQTTSKAITEVVYATPVCPVFKCELAQGEYVGEFSQLLLLARVTTPGAADEGEYFVFAVANSPLKVLAPVDAALFNVGVLF
jgi:hypothetical protein